MQQRPFGSTDWNLGAVGFGAWAIGGDWGKVDDAQSIAAMHAAVDAGVNFFDTADVYGDGHSEQLVGRLLTERPEHLYVATKMGRRAPLQLERYTLKNFIDWTDRSRRNLGVDRLDLVQLHCLGIDVMYAPAVFEALEALRERGSIAHYGVSVERVEEGLKALEWPGVVSIQVVYNAFRQRPHALLFEQAARRGVAIIVRVPLASGLLTGKLAPDSRFAEGDHRASNRHGELFDVGETFAGVDYETGLRAVERLRPLVPDGFTMAQFALRWVLMRPEVSTVIAGARNPEQARANAAAADLPPLGDDVMRQVAAIYAQDVAPLVHQRW